MLGNLLEQDFNLKPDQSVFIKVTFNDQKRVLEIKLHSDPNPDKEYLEEMNPISVSDVTFVENFSTSPSENDKAYVDSIRHVFDVYLKRINTLNTIYRDKRDNIKKYPAFQEEYHVKLTNELKLKYFIQD